MSNMIGIGSVVVCIDADPASFVRPEWTEHARPGDMHGLTEGGVYVVRWIGEYYSVWSEQFIIAVKLNEIIRPCEDAPYNIKRFRPAKRTNISIFTAELKELEIAGS